MPMRLAKGAALSKREDICVLDANGEVWEWGRLVMVCLGRHRKKKTDPSEYCSALYLLLGWQKGVPVGEWKKEG